MELYAICLSYEECSFIVSAVQAAESLKAPVPGQLKMKCLDAIVDLIRREYPCEPEPSHSDANVENVSL